MNRATIALLAATILLGGCHRAGVRTSIVVPARVVTHHHLESEVVTVQQTATNVYPVSRRVVVVNPPQVVRQREVIVRRDSRYEVATPVRSHPQDRGRIYVERPQEVKAKGPAIRTRYRDAPSHRDDERGRGNGKGNDKGHAYGRDKEHPANGHRQDNGDKGGNGNAYGRDKEHPSYGHRQDNGGKGNGNGYAYGRDKERPSNGHGQDNGSKGGNGNTYAYGRDKERPFNGHGQDNGDKGKGNGYAYGRDKDHSSNGHAYGRGDGNPSQGGGRGNGKTSESVRDEEKGNGKDRGRGKEA